MSKICVVNPRGCIENMSEVLSSPSLFQLFADAVLQFSSIIGLSCIVGSVIYTAFKVATRGSKKEK